MARESQSRQHRPHSNLFIVVAGFCLSALLTLQPTWAYEPYDSPGLRDFDRVDRLQELLNVGNRYRFRTYRPVRYRDRDDGCNFGCSTGRCRQRDTGDRLDSRGLGSDGRHRPEFHDDLGEERRRIDFERLRREHFDSDFDDFDLPRRNRHRRSSPDSGPFDLDYDEYEENVPRERVSDEPTDDERISFRYQDPTVVRYANSLTSSQGLALFREVSELIDQRHLQPATYHDRISQSVKNLSLAVRNQHFRSATGQQASSRQIERFRNEMRSLLGARSVSNYNDAASFVQATMQIAARSVNLRPGLVAYEFVNGSIQSLDRFSAFEPTVSRVTGAIDELPVQTAMSPLDEHIVGIGVEVRQHDDGLEVVRVLRGGPARDAGLRPRDIILGINGRRIAGQNMNASIAMIGGPQGSAIQLDVRRGDSRSRSLRLVRRRFRVYSVNDVRIVDRNQGVGYLKLDKFAQSSVEELDQALRELRQRGMRSLIVDVRGNSGGLLTTAIDISDRFLRCGTIVSTRGRLSSDNMRRSASSPNTWAIPLVVLTDGDSASASEIFAAAVQDNGRGVIVGDRTYGKGSVQTHFPLRSGMGTIRLTTAKFFSPQDRPMSGSGVSPDVQVSSRGEGTRDDAVLERAVSLAGHSRLVEMAKAHGNCRHDNHPVDQFSRNSIDETIAAVSS